MDLRGFSSTRARLMLAAVLLGPAAAAPVRSQTPPPIAGAFSREFTLANTAGRPGDEPPITGAFSREFTLANTRVDPEGLPPITGAVSREFTLTTPVPDLVTTALVPSPSAAVIGAPGTIRWRVENRGEGTARGPWADRVSLSRDPAVGSDTVLGSVIYDRGPVPPQGFYEGTLSFTFPESLGQFWIVIEIGREGALSEENRANNTLVGDITLRVERPPAPDLAVTQVAAPGGISLAGSAVEVSFVVANQSANATYIASWTDSLFLVRTPVLATHLASEVLLAQVPNQRALLPGDSYRQSVLVTLPARLEGEFRLAAYADSRRRGAWNLGDPHDQEEESESNNWAFSVAFPVAVSAFQPDLEPRAITLGDADADDLSSSQLLAVAWNDENIGTADTDTGGWTDEVYLSVNATPAVTPGDVLLGTRRRSGNALLPGGKAALAIEKALPADLNGVFFVKVAADIHDEVFEHRLEGNNVTVRQRSLTVTLSPAIDLTPVAVAAAAEGYPGHPLHVAYEVRNIGAPPLDLPHTWQDALYLSSDARFDRGQDVLLGAFGRATARDAGGVLRLSDYAEEVNVTLPVGTVAGTFFVLVVADHRDDVFEGRDLPGPADDDLKERNNVRASGPVLVRSLSADLVIEMGNGTSGAGAAGQVITAAFTVRNAGLLPTPADSWTDALYLSADAALDGGDRHLGAVARTETLATGAGYAVERRVTVPLVPPGEYFLLAATDIYDRIPELGPAEANNAAARAFTVTAEGADLEVAAAAVPAAARAGEFVFLEWTVANAGSLSTLANLWSDAVYLSADAVLDPSDRELAVRTRGDFLGPGRSYVASGSFPIPGDLAGVFHVIFKTDTGGRVFETDEADNVRVQTMVLQVERAVAANLVVAGVTVDGTVLSGQRVRVGWTVRNDGDGPTTAAPWQDSVFLSRDRVLDPRADVFLGARVHEGVLLPGQSYDADLDLDVPLGVSGPHFLFVAADRGGRNFEAAVTIDNQAAAPDLLDVVLPAPSDLAVRDVIHPANAVLGEPLRVEWRIANEGQAAVEGRWHDAVFLSRDGVLDIDDVELGTFESVLGSPLAAGAGAFFQGSAPLPSLTPGDYRVLVLADLFDAILEDGEGPNAGASTGTVRVGATPLVLDGEPVEASLPAGAERYFELAAPAGRTVRVTLEHQDPEAWTELYAGFAAAPAPGRFDFRSDAVGEADQSLTIPRTLAGIYYLSARGARGGGAGADGMRIRAVTLPFALEAVRPARIGDRGRVTLAIAGSQLEAGSEVRLERAGAPALVARRVQWLDGTRLEATLLLAGAGHGAHDLVATRPGGGSARLPGAVTVEAAVPPVLELAAPDAPALRQGASAGTFEQPVVNRGNVDAEYVFLLAVIEASAGREVIDLRSSSPFIRDVLRGGFHLESSLVRSLAPGEAAFLAVTARAGLETAGAIAVGHGAAVFSTEKFLEFEERAAEAARLAVIADESLLVEEARDVPLDLAGDPGAWREYWLARLADIGLVDAADVEDFLGAAPPVPGRAQCLERPRSAGDLPPFCATLAERLCAEWRERLVEVGAEASGFFAEGPGERATDLVACVPEALVACSACSHWPVQAAIDPNEKTGSEGAGEEGFIPQGQPLSYRIYFENVPEATAPAAVVRIADRLDPALNPGSFRLGNIAFGDTVIAVPADQVFFQKRVDLAGDLELAGLSLQITAGLRADRNEAFWTLRTVEDASGLPPSDARRGFLPPTDESGKGLGWVEFTVEPKPAAGDGIIILNDAAITFDDNEPITTNQTAHRVDGSAPGSRMAPLPALVDGPSIPLAWALDGAAETADVAGFTIQVAIDGGAFAPFLVRTAARSAAYPGEPGRSYAFFSQAVDHAGNVEEPPAHPDAVTAVRGGDASFRRGDANPDGRVNITDAIFSLGYQFLGQRAPPCLDAADANDDGRINITDPIFLLNALFAGGPPVPAPGIAACGADPTADALAPCVAAQSGCP